MSKKMTNRIGAVRAELEINDDGTTSCFVFKGNKSSSLDCALQQSEWSSDLSEVSLSDYKSITTLGDWAIENGY